MFNHAFYCLWTKPNIWKFLNESDLLNGVEKLYTNLRNTKDYTSELEKLTRNDNKTVLYFTSEIIIWEYPMRKYCYMLRYKGLTMEHKAYIIGKQIDFGNANEMNNNT